ncbi:hypothetical protein GQ600_24468 [Phytophthora cactorum]|nr:hypothetical protein GQ600_24468 [Phytophthora cactorum]
MGMSSFSKTVSLKKNLAMTAVTVLLVNVVVTGESYEGKRALRQQSSRSWRWRRTTTQSVDLWK